MESYSSLLLFLLLLLSPVFIVGVGLWVLRRLEGEHRRKSPVSEKVCRYPGFSLSKEIEKLDESLSTDLVTLILIPAGLIVIIGSGRFEISGPIAWLIFGGAYIIGIGFFVVRLFRNSRKLRMTRLGLAGEQVVGHQLGELLRSGFYVFHDFPLDYGNIDHVVVGPSGVFAIETKYKRKMKDVEDGHKMFYNGKRLKVGDSETSVHLAQSKRQAKKLNELLCSMFEISEVTPVLVFPGWWIEMEKGNAEVLVLNHNAVAGYLSKQAAKLSPTVVSRVAAYLDGQCRDVEV